MSLINNKVKPLTIDSPKQLSTRTDSVFNIGTQSSKDKSTKQIQKFHRTPLN